MGDLINFEYGARPVRVVTIDGEPWFVAADVCQVLEISNPSDALSRLDADERNTLALTEGTPGNPNKAIVSEAGLYNLVMGSRKPEAKAFKRWVTHDVLPSIRKHGMYAKDEILDNPDLLIEVATRLRDEKNARLAAEAKVAELEPKAEFFDAVSDSKDAQSIRDVAKILGTGQNRLFSWLRGEKILLPSNRPYQRYVDEGYFRVIERTWADESGENHLYIKPLVTGKGLTWLQKRYGKGA